MTFVTVKTATSANKAITLKGCTAADKARSVTITDGDNNANTYNITVTPSTGTINNASSYAITSNSATLTLACDGNSNWVVSSGVSSTALENLFHNTTGHTYYAKRYGSCTWSSTTDTQPCIQAAIDDARANGGGTVVLPAGDFGLSTVLTLPIDGLVSLEGAGLESGTILRALSGLTGGVMLSGGTDSGTNFIVRGVQVKKIKFACADLAATAIFARSWQQFRVQDIFINSCTSKAMDLGVGAVNTWGMAFGVFDNIIISLETTASANAHAITINQSTGTADDLHSITFSNIRTTAKNGDGFRCGQADAILVLRFMHTLVSGGTGVAARMLAHDTAASVCRKVHFVASGFGSGAGAGQGLVLQGTETAANAVWNITSEMSIQGDGQPEPTVGTGVTGFICVKMGGAMCTGSQPIGNFKYRPPVTNVNTTTALTSNDCGKIYNNRTGSGNETIILPASSGSGCTFEFTKWSSGSGLTISAAGSDSIATTQGSVTALATTGDTHTNTTLDNLGSTANLYAGMLVSGTGIPANTLIASVDSATQVTLDTAATATAAGVSITFSAAVKTSTNWSSIRLQDQGTAQWTIVAQTGNWRDSSGDRILFGATIDANSLIQTNSFKVSTATLSKTNNTTFAVVPGLEISLDAGKTYNCSGHLTVTASGAGGGIKVTLQTPDTLTLTSGSFTAINYNGTTINAQSTATALNTAVGNANAVVTDVYIAAGLVINAAGTLQVRAAQNTSDAATTTVGTNSIFNCALAN